MDQELKDALDKMQSSIDGVSGEIKTLKAELGTMEARFEAKLGTMEARFEAKLGTMEAKFETLAKAQDGLSEDVDRMRVGLRESQIDNERQRETYRRASAFGFASSMLPRSQDMIVPGTHFRPRQGSHRPVSVHDS